MKWTVDTLRVLVEANDRRYKQRFGDQERAVAAALAAQEKAVAAALKAAETAVSKAESAAEKRFDSVNEFRATLADQTATLMPRSETDIRLTALGDRLTAAERQLAQSSGRTGGVQASWAVLVGLVTVAAAIIGIFLAVH